jgi:hypothetical protein
MSREYTKEEVTYMFMEQVKTSINHWAEFDGNKKDSLEGLAHSMLSIIDGCTLLPGFALIPQPHQEDKECLEEEGRNYFRQFEGDDMDIGGELRYYLSRMELAKKNAKESVK